MSSIAPDRLDYASAAIESHEIWTIAEVTEYLEAIRVRVASHAYADARRMKVHLYYTVLRMVALGRTDSDRMARRAIEAEGIVAGTPIA